ncbi:MAG: 1-acyl-sn-glycerol-3-phosphate acyltransferase [Kineosporiaceae bacterium]|nr:1-acyl-sn-glycerol-3-phosphate acyltransferase [Kineosporiaceae bacterium]
MRDLVYPPVIGVARGLFLALGLRFDIQGTENLPRAGGAVIASNHVSYLDFTFLGLGALRQKRYIRFMAKDAVFHHRVSGPLMRGMHHIPVDRTAGSAAFKHALSALRSGELVGVFPEATISRSFLLKDFKPGAVRMAAAAGVPVIPAVVWGGQRIFTKGRPKDFRGRGKAITVAFGEPMSVGKGAGVEAASQQLISTMAAMLDRVQHAYPQHPSGPQDTWWLPASLGGTAPTPQEAALLDAEDRAKRGGV